MALSAAIQTEIQRKAANNIPLTNATPEATAAYNDAKAKLAPVSNTATTPTTNAAPVPMAPISNAATSNTNPTTGYGGATYGSSSAANQAIMANAAKLNSDPNYVASEIARTQQVIKERQAQGLDTSAQMKYLTQNLGYNPVTQTGVGTTPNTDMIYNPGSFGGYDPTAEEQAYLANQIAGYQGQADAAKSAAQYGVDTNNAYLQDQLKALQEQKNVDTNSAQELQNRRGGFYSGGLDTQLASIDSGYANNVNTLTRDVEGRNQQLLDQYGNTANTIAQQINTLRQSAPDIIRSRIQDWINNERQYGLDYANTFGSLNGQQTLGAQSQQFNQDLQNKQANLNAALSVGQSSNRLVTPQSDWSGLFRQVLDPNTPLNAAGQAFVYGQQQDAFNNTLAQQRQNADIANQQAQTALDYQTYQDGLNQGTGGKSASGLTPNQIFSSILDQYSAPTYNSNGQSTGTKITSDPVQRQQMIAQLLLSTRGLSDAQTEQLAAALGITSDEWKKATGHGLGE